MKQRNMECSQSSGNPAKPMISGAFLILMGPVLFAATAEFSITPDIKGALGPQT
jgi:hypothetical protein